MSLQSLCLGSWLLDAGSAEEVASLFDLIGAERVAVPHVVEHKRPAGWSAGEVTVFSECCG